MINISNRIWIEKKVETLKAKYTITSMTFVKIRNDEIEDEQISRKLDRIEGLTRSIFDYVDEHPDKIGRIKNFTGYYLPTTMKILNAYAQFEKQEVAGANITGAMQDIEEILDTLVKAFENQLDSLFMDEALDVSTDITVLENMLRREGLTGSGFRVE